MVTNKWQNQDSLLILRASQLHNLGVVSVWREEAIRIHRSQETGRGELDRKKVILGSGQGSCCFLPPGGGGQVSSLTNAGVDLGDLGHPATGQWCLHWDEGEGCRQGGLGKGWVPLSNLYKEGPCPEKGWAGGVSRSFTRHS